MPTRTLRALALGAVAALALSACGTSTESTESPESTTSDIASESTQAADPGTSESIVRFYNDKGAWEPQFTAMSDAAKASIGVGLEVFGYTDSATYDSFIKQAVVTNEKPTLFTWHTGGQLDELAATGVVAESKSLWEKAIADGDVAASLEAQFQADGTTYCVPLAIHYWAMYYSKPIFAKYNLEPPETWADLEQIVATLVENGETPMYHTSILFSFVWFETLMVNKYPDVYNKLATGEASYTDPEVVDVMNMWQSQIEAGWFSDPLITDSPENLLQSGKVAMINFGTFLSGQLKAVDMTSDDYGVFTIPMIDPAITSPSLIIEAGPWCIAAGAENEAAAEKLLAWWFTPEAQQIWVDESAGISFNTAVEPADPALVDLVNEIASGNYTLYERYFEAAPAPVLTAALDAFGAFVTDPSDPLTLLQNIQAEADAFWAEN
jgi:multiple sugar transport system substrate-binding protein